MIAGDRAVVVDYKFGDRDAERYRRQIGGYCTLLRGMATPASKATCGMSGGARWSGWYNRVRRRH